MLPMYSRCTSYKWYRPTHLFWFNFEPASQLIASSMLVNPRHYSNRRWSEKLSTTVTSKQNRFNHTIVYRTHWTVKQFWFNVDPTCLMMAKQQSSIGSLPLAGSAAYFAAALRHGYEGDAFFPVARKVTTKITRYIGPMLMECWATICDANMLLLFQPYPFRI